MRRFLVIATIIVIMTAAFLFIGGLVLAQAAPLRPGDTLFSFQRFAEQERLWITSGKAERADYLIRLAERRVVDLSALITTEKEDVALQELNLALDKAIDAIGLVPSGDAGTISVELTNLVDHAKAVLSLLQVAPTIDPDLYTLMQAKIETLASLLEDVKVAASQKEVASSFLSMMPGADGASAPTQDPNRSGAGIVPMAVLFPPGSAGAEHAFFPLTGQHTTLQCEQCHLNGEYAGTPNQCVDCHADVKPLNHFQGDCASCHNANSWKEVTFDHAAAGATNCQSCHNKDKPANHYDGQCSACHNTTNWKQATFNHQVAGATNCQSCHSKDKPANHYNGQCSACHNTKDWKQATFNHDAAGATDCQSCHTKNKPANHFNGQCSACHNTSNWKSATFNHQAMGATDCQTCHSKDKPANHFSGQCSACHNTSDWKQANFNHKAAGATDCQSCHTKNKPANHFNGQCSECHSTNSWKGASFDHTGLTDCQSCHNKDKPANHFSGQCSQCHTTSSWKGASFNHSGQTDCQSCHTKDKPANHYSGQCSQLP